MIKNNDTATDVYKKATHGGIRLIKKYAPMLVRETAPRIPQVESAATYFQPRKLKDNEISTTDTAEQAYAKIRALSPPYKGAYIRRGGKKIIIWDAEICDYEEKK